MNTEYFIDFLKKKSLPFSRVIFDNSNMCMLLWKYMFITYLVLNLL